MALDFELILTLATLLTGAVWIGDRIFVAMRRRTMASASADPSEASSKEPLVVEYARSLFPILLIVLVLRSFVFEPFRIPSGSMLPTLQVGDFILVNKFSYGLRLPVIHDEFLDLGEPERGDVIVFRFPPRPATDYIKRVVGLPGDRIVYRDHALLINGERIEAEPLGPYRGTGANHSPNAVRMIEDLGATEHHILVTTAGRSRHPHANGEYRVPEDHYFVLGDNRDNSLDSRFWGFVPADNLVGKAMVVWMNWDWDSDGFPLRWGRIGHVIH